MTEVFSPGYTPIPPQESVGHLLLKKLKIFIFSTKIISKDFYIILLVCQIFFYKFLYPSTPFTS